MVEIKTDSMPNRKFSFLDVAKEFVPKILDASRVISEGREIPPQLASEMAEEGLFRLYIPKSVGGYEIDYLEFLELVSVIAEADGSVGWCFNQNNVLSTLSAFMPKELAQEIWSDPTVVLSIGPPISPVAVPVEGGYQLNGRWNFSSGSRHAKWVVALAPVKGRVLEGGESPEMRNMMIPKEEVEFIDTWEVNGLRGTGSFSFTAKDLFVPESHSFVEGGPPREEGPIYLIPKSLLFCSGFATTALGVARGALNAVIELSSAKTPQEQDLLMKQPFTQREIGQAEAIWRSANAYLRDSSEAVWESAVNDRVIPVETRINLRLSSTHAIREAVKVADMAYSLSGATAIFETSPIQRRMQDVRVISQQIQGRMSHYDTAGQYFLGMDPKSRLF